MNKQLVKARREYLAVVWTETDIECEGYEVSFVYKVFGVMHVKLSPEKRYEVFKKFGEEAHELTWINFDIDRPYESWLLMSYGSEAGSKYLLLDDKLWAPDVISYVREQLMPKYDFIVQKFTAAVKANIKAECVELLKEAN